MDQFKNTNIPENFNDEVNMREIFQILIMARWFILALTAFTGLATLAYSLYLPNIYESEVLLSPNENSNKSSFIENYSSLANLAGVNLPKESIDSNSIKAIKKIESLSFFESNILPNIFLPNLMAYKSWNSKTNENKYNKNIYDATLKKWVRKYKHPQKLIPSSQEAFDIFNKQHLRISEDNSGNFITIKVRHKSAIIAQLWASLLIEEINSFYRQKDKKEAEKAVNYLNYQISKTNLNETKIVLAALLQKEIQKLTLIEANYYYVYEYIDPPVVMEKKSEPNRLVIFIVAILFGLTVSIVIVFVRHYSRENF